MPKLDDLLISDASLLALASLADGTGVVSFAGCFLFAVEAFWLLAVDAPEEAVEAGRGGFDGMISMVVLGVDIVASASFWNETSLMKFCAEMRKDDEAV